MTSLQKFSFCFLNNTISYYYFSILKENSAYKKSMKNSDFSSLNNMLVYGLKTERLSRNNKRRKIMKQYHNKITIKSSLS